MANLGNTGQRYKMATIVRIIPDEQGHADWVLSCGHIRRGVYYSPEHTPENVGKRIRCNACKGYCMQ